MSTDKRIVKIRFFDYGKSIKMGRKRTVAGELINFRSRLTHSEFEFSSVYHHLSFSATIEDAFKGCRFKLIHYTHNWWRTVEREVTAGQEEDIWYRAHQINGKKYDLIGILGYATPWKILVPHRDRYWCSKSNAFVMRSSIYAGEKNEITPDELFAWLRTHPQTE